MKYYADAIQVTSVGSFSLAGFIASNNNHSMSKSVVVKRSGVRQECCYECDFRLRTHTHTHTHTCVRTHKHTP